MHVDWFRFCALRHDDKAREMLAEIADNCGSKEERQPGKRLETLESLASEDAFQTVLASQPNTHFSIVDNALGFLGLHCLVLDW